MSEDFKKRVQNSITNYYKRIDKELKPQSKQKNQQPEAELRKLVLKELRLAGFLALYVESKAVFSQQLGQYLHSQVQPGTSDLICLDSYGNFLAVELKAPGRVGTLKDHQREFLLSVIDRNGFACCVDSFESLINLYNKWIKEKNREIRQALLVSALPIKKSRKESELFKME